MPGIDRPGFGCAEFVDEAYELARKPEIETVVISASWVGLSDRVDYYRVGDAHEKPLKVFQPENRWILDGFERAVRRLVVQGKNVVIVLSSPKGEQFDPAQMAKRDGLNFHVVLHDAVPRSVVDSDRASIDDVIIQIARRTGASTLDPVDTICSSTTCPVLDVNGKPLLKDASHLRSSFVTSHFDAFDRFVLF